MSQPQIVEQPQLPPVTPSEILGYVKMRDTAQLVDQLGRQSVNSMETATGIITLPDSADAFLLEKTGRPRDELIATSTRLIAVDLATSRAVIRGFDEQRANSVHKMIERVQSLPPFIRKQKPEGMTWAAWFGDEAHGATDLQLLNFFQWHEHHLETHNSKEASPSPAETMINESQARLKNSVELGLLPEIVGERVSPIDSKLVFRSLFRLAHERIVGFALRDDKAVDGGKSVNIFSPEYAHVLLHEIAHGEIGKIAPPEGDYKWLNEAITEIIAILGEQTEVPEDVLELVSRDQDGYYATQDRQGLVGLIRASDGELTLEGVIKAYASVDQTEKDKVIELVDRLFAQTKEAKIIGISSFTEVPEYLRNLVEELEEEGDMEGVTVRELERCLLLDIYNETAPERTELDSAPEGND